MKHSVDPSYVGQLHSCAVSQSVLRKPESTFRTEYHALYERGTRSALTVCLGFKAERLSYDFHGPHAKMWPSGAIHLFGRDAYFATSIAGGCHVPWPTGRIDG